MNLKLFRFLISRRVPSGGAGLAHRHVGVAAEAAFLHVAVADADPGHDLVQLLGIGHGFGAERMSGSVTISSSGVPARFRSMPLMP
jgi:hypothetical protein